MVAALLVIALPAVHFAGDLGGEIREYDGFATLNRSLGFLQTGDWLSITSNYRPVFTKPPLQYMLTAGLLAAGLEAERAVRVAPFVFTVGTLLLTAWLAWIVAPGVVWSIPAAALLVVGSPLVWHNGRVALLDAGNAFFVVLTVAAVLLAERNPRWWWLAGIAAGLGFLQKTPVALGAGAFSIGALCRGDRAVFEWRELRREIHFRAGLWAALGLSLFWPLVQLVRHGVWFLVIFVGEQWLQRFAPVNPVDGASVFDPLRWVGWLLDDAAFIWSPVLLLVIAALGLSRFRAQPGLRALAGLVAVCAALMSIAGGSLYPRYLLVMMPFMAVIAAVVLAQWLPRSWLAVLVCAVALAAGLSSWQERTTLGAGPDRSEMRRVGQRFRALLQDGETPVFIRPANSLGFSEDAFVYFAGVGRETLMVRHDKWWQFAPKAERSGLRPPYAGVIHEEYYPDAETRLGPLLELERVGPYVIWRQLEARPIRGM